MSEIWRGVLGYEPWYEVSNLGRCRAIQRPSRGGGRCFNERYPLLLTPLRYRKGYYKIQLGGCDGSRQRRRLFLHRMIWEAFNGPILQGLTINHLDGVRSNNCLDNLEQADFVRQVHHAASIGLIRLRMSPSTVRELRQLHAKGWTQTALAQRYNTTRSNIRWILIGRTWSHVM